MGMSPVWCAMVSATTPTQLLSSSLRGAERRSNPRFGLREMDCFASLAMTVE
jgi:hypothetical protein